MAQIHERNGPKPRTAARIVRAMRQLSNRNEPITTAVLRREVTGVPNATILRAGQWLEREAGLLKRRIQGTNVREYLLGSQSARWGIQVEPELIRCYARTEITLLVLLNDWEAKR